MKFLVIINANGALAHLLLDHGYDALMVSDIDPRMEDPKTLRWVLQGKRIIVTTDQNFEDMIWREKSPHTGVLRLENLPRVERLSLLEYSLNFYSQDLE
jgi:predicted nuclease of predicted toxin-antitoxin system